MNTPHPECHASHIDDQRAQEISKSQAERWRKWKMGIEVIHCGQLTEFQATRFHPRFGATGELRQCKVCGAEFRIDPNPEAR